MNIRKEIKNTFAAVLALTLIMVVVLTLINGPTNYKQAQPFLMPLKEALATTANYFGGIASLGAAYIASLLFIDWREVEKFKRHGEVLDKLYFSSLEIHKKLSKLLVITHKTTTTLDAKKNISRDIMDELHFAVTYVALDHIKSIKDNNNIQAYYDLLTSLTNKQRLYRKVLIQDSKLQPTNFSQSNQILKESLDFLNQTLDAMVSKNLT